MAIATFGINNPDPEQRQVAIWSRKPKSDRNGEILQRVTSSSGGTQPRYKVGVLIHDQVELLTRQTFVD